MATKVYRKLIYKNIQTEVYLYSKSIQVVLIWTGLNNALCCEKQSEL